MRIVVGKNNVENVIKKDELYLYVGDIENMTDFIAFSDKHGHVYWGYHKDNFRELKEDEL